MVHEIYILIIISFGSQPPQVYPSLDTFKTFAACDTSRIEDNNNYPLNDKAKRYCVKVTIKE
jgi:hypothetical protein